MTRTGTAFQLRPLAPRTFVTGSSWLPTPSATPYGSNQSPSPGAVVRPSLDTMARTGMWPTPTAADGVRSTTYQSRPDGSRSLTLIGAVKQQWPTPTANRRSGLQSHGRNAILGQLNPMWVEWLMGFPLGWTDLEGSAMP